MLKRTIILINVFVLFLLSDGLGQDLNFTQFHTNLLEVNPAYAGSALQPRASLNYRNQWPGIDAAFVVYSASVDHFIEKHNSGVGLKISNDRQGDGLINFLNIDLLYSYTLQLREWFLVGALQAGYGQNSFNANNAIFPDNIHPINGAIGASSESLGNEKNGYLDFATGVTGYFRDHHFGFALHHITRPLSIQGSVMQNINRKYTVNYGYTFPIHINGWVEPHFYLSPSFMFQKQGDFDQIIYGLYVNSRPLTYGAWIRQSLDILPNSLVFLIGYNKGSYKFSYSYDLSLNKLIGLTFGTHEIGFVYLIDIPKTESKPYEALIKDSWF